MTTVNKSLSETCLMWSPVGPHVQWNLSNVVTYGTSCTVEPVHNLQYIICEILNVATQTFVSLGSCTTLPLLCFYVHGRSDKLAYSLQFASKEPSHVLEYQMTSKVCRCFYSWWLF